MVAMLVVSVAHAAPPTSQPKSKPESRPAQAPAAGSVDALLAHRDAQLARYADQGLRADERHAALVEANQLLERVIEIMPDDPRAVGWRFDLGRSLLYQEAEPYYLNILYRGGNTQDRAKLVQTMEKAAGILAVLRAGIAREFERMDRMAPGKYEELERSGQVSRLEGLTPKTEYMERWVKFYRALAREPDDPLLAQELGALLDDLKGRSGLLDTPHRETHVQAQLKLLAGMCARLLGDPVAAEHYLSSAVQIVRSIKDKGERSDLGWVVNLALVENVKLERDRGQYDRALDGLRDLQAQTAVVAQDSFALQLAAALLEGTIYKAQADRAREQGRSAEVRKYENMRYEPLMKLARQGSDARDAVYAAIYDSLDPKSDPSGLHPLAGCALVAGLLADAGRIAADISAKEEAGGSSSSSEIDHLENQRLALLDRAISAAEHFHKNAERTPPELRSEIHYGLAAAQFQRGRRLEAARGFLDIARDDRQFRLAQHAAAVAVQIAGELAEDLSLRDRADVRQLQLESLQVLTHHYPQSDDARYCQFFLGQTLFDGGRFDEAAESFARVKPDHEYHVPAAFLRLRALAALTAAAAKTELDRARLEALVANVVDAARAFRQSAESAQKGDQRQISGFLAESDVLAVEAKLALGASEATWVLERLTGFEDRYPDHGRLFGRVLRARIIAYQHLERLPEAEQAIPDYVRREPRTAGATLQGLFDALRREIEDLTQRGRPDEAQRKTAAAVLLARQIHVWAQGADSGVDAQERYAVELQLAEALLGGGQLTEAQAVFARCMAQDAKLHADGRARDVRAILGNAESLYQLKSYEAALPLFNRLSRESGLTDALRFQALLRDLQCRTDLNHPAEGIIKVIRQQKFLESEMGGKELRAEFDALLRLNENRLKV